MSETRFTKGPWFVGATNPNPDEPDEIAILVGIPETAPLCVAVAIPTGTGRDMEPERTRANAHLIAAAPKLYADLADCIDRLLGAIALLRVRNETQMAEHLEQEVERYRDTLRLARGETE